MVRMIKPDGRLHTDIDCPKCGTEMTELEFDRKDMEKFFLWESYRKCSKCGVRVMWH